MYMAFPCVSAGKESTCNAGDLCSTLGWEDPRRRERLPTPVFWCGEFNGLYSSWGCKKLDTTERLSLSLMNIDKHPFFFFFFQFLLCWVFVVVGRGYYSCRTQVCLAVAQGPCVWCMSLGALWHVGS